MGYENTLFNGKSMRNAIITKLSEDKHLTSALFANSNITILIDIVSYMYQCLMSNLRQAASESMWSDTMFFENAARLAKMIGYYAKGQIPYTMLARISQEESGNIAIPKFANVNLSYGPYDYMFAVVETNVNKDQNLVRLALGKWKETDEGAFVSDGTKFQEFIVSENSEESGEYISQKYVHVEVNGKEWKYTPNPLFIQLNKSYNTLEDSGAQASRSATVVEEESEMYNFYINENGSYVLKFGDGISTAIPPNGANISVKYVVFSETDKTITSTIKNAMLNAPASPLQPAFGVTDSLETDKPIMCTPITVMSGYKDIDDVETIKKNSALTFSRQNRLVTKSDYKSYLLENRLDWKDVTVQNNWEFVSSFYGWLYAIELKQPESGEKRNIIDENNLQMFQSPDLADANNVYFWVLDKNTVDSSGTQEDYQDVQNGIISDLSTGTESNLLVGAMKDITIKPVFLNAVCKRFAPCAITLSEISELIDYSNRNPFKNYESYFRIHVDSDYSNSLNIIKSKTYQYFKTYLFDNIMLGVTPNISALIKDLMAIDGVINITTVFNSQHDGDISTEYETNGMRFCTWTDTYNTFVFASEDVDVSYNLPNIPCFQYLKSILSFNEFIKNSLKFKLDYSIKA